MSLEYIRKTYSVPAYRGQRVCYTGSNKFGIYGTITSSKGPYIRILVDDRVEGYRGRLILHPTWKVEYLNNDKAKAGSKERNI